MELRDQKDGQGRYLTFAMFFETRNPNYKATFTTKEYDHTVDGVTYLSMRKLYMEMADPTEYEFAMTLLGSWDHWNKLCKSSALKSHVEAWRDELEIKMKAQLIRAMMHTATEEGAKGTTAAKWLATAGWKSGKGRPTKEQVKGALNKEAKITSVVEADAARLGLVKK